jgi:hypothetical protein
MILSCLFSLIQVTSTNGGKGIGRVPTMYQVPLHPMRGTQRDSEIQEIVAFMQVCQNDIHLTLCIALHLIFTSKGKP